MPPLESATSHQVIRLRQISNLFPNPGFVWLNRLTPRASDYCILTNQHLPVDPKDLAYAVISGSLTHSLRFLETFDPNTLSHDFGSRNQPFFWPPHLIEVIKYGREDGTWITEEGFSA
jgi:hypothetical protein